MAQMHSDAPRPPEWYFEAEKRDPEWASRMEANLSQRFDAAVLESSGVPSVKVEDLVCRQSSCRITLSWNQSDMDGVQSDPFAGWKDPLTRLVHSTGPLAAMETRLSPTGRPLPNSNEVGVSADGRLQTTAILMFGREDIDPDSYAAFASRHRDVFKKHLPTAP